MNLRLHDTLASPVKLKHGGARPSRNRPYRSSREPFIASPLGEFSQWAISPLDQLLALATHVGYKSPGASGPRSTNMPFDVFQIVPSSSSRRVLISALEKNVAIGDITARSASSTIQTIHDGTLVLSDELDVIVAAAYHIHGVVGYSAASGRELWRRKDLKKAQSLNLSKDGAKAFIGFQKGPLVAIDLKSGDTIQTHRAARSLLESPFDAVCFVDGMKPQLTDGEMQRLAYIPRTTFAFLSTIFCPGRFVTTESTGPVRCVDIRSGAELWRYTPVAGSHVLQLGYRSQRAAVLGIEWPYEEGGSMKLLEFAPESGRVRDILELDYVSIGFALDGRVAITSKGQFIDTETGAYCPAWSAIPDAANVQSKP